LLSVFDIQVDTGGERLIHGDSMKSERLMASCVMSLISARLLPTLLTNRTLGLATVNVRVTSVGGVRVTAWARL
jgi:hypothetical protein